MTTKKKLEIKEWLLDYRINDCMYLACVDGNFIQPNSVVLKSWKSLWEMVNQKLKEA